MTHRCCSYFNAGLNGSGQWNATQGVVAGLGNRGKDYKLCREVAPALMESLIFYKFFGLGRVSFAP
jgi:hypothetical protein